MENIIKGTSASVVKKILELLLEKVKENKNEKINLSAEDLSLIFIINDTFPGLITIFDNKKASDINHCSKKTLEDELISIKTLLEKIS